MTFARIKYEKHGGLATVTLNTPERLNVLAMGPGSNRAEIDEALADAQADDAIGAILINAAGRAFCAGGDLKAAAARNSILDDVRFFEQGERYHAGMRSCTKPVIAAVHGLCLGAGLSFIAQCDIVIAAEGAEFGLPEGRMGLGGASELIHIIGPAWAKFLVFTGERIGARRAQRIGLVLGIVPDDRLAERSRDLAERISRMPREGLMLNKACIDRVERASGADAGRQVALAFDPIITSMAPYARAPDGRTFREIVRDEGMKGLKQARDDHYGQPWLRD